MNVNTNYHYQKCWFSKKKSEPANNKKNSRIRHLENRMKSIEHISENIYSSVCKLEVLLKVLTLFVKQYFIVHHMIEIL